MIPSVPPVASVDGSRGKRTPLFQVEQLSKFYQRSQGWLRSPVVVHAVNNVTLYLHRQQTLAVVGESGCGKTTLARCALRLVEPTVGRLWFNGRSLWHLTQKQLRPLRKQMQYTFQDPLASLNPMMSVDDIVAEGIRIHITKNKSEVSARVASILGAVGLDVRLAKRFPHELSTGERQRVGIARALAVEPLLVVLDEPVSALDAGLRAHVTQMLLSVQHKRELSYLLISHNLDVVRAMSHRVAVMYAGRFVEIGLTDDVLTNPMHPYTRALLSAQPVPDPTRRRLRVMLEGEPPDLANLPSGCVFHPRCPMSDSAQCAALTPALEELEPGSHHRVACWYASEQ